MLAASGGATSVPQSSSSSSSSAMVTPDSPITSSPLLGGGGGGPISGDIFLEPSSGAETSYEKKVKIAKALLQYASEVTETDLRVNQIHQFNMDRLEVPIEKFNKQLQEAEAEKARYEEFIKELEAAAEESDGNEDSDDEEMRQLEQEERQLREELIKIAQEREQLRREKAEVEKEQKQLTTLEDGYWNEYNSYIIQLQAYEDERDALKQRISHVNEELNRLNGTNLYNDAFHIWYDGHFGTINNLRLGRLPSIPVEWNEINAAWGHAALLLASIAKKKNLTFNSYIISPMGSFSKVEKINNGVYELYGGGGFFRWQSKFDKAMIGYVSCLQQMAEFAQAKDPQFKLPYPIVGDKVGGITIKYQGSSEDKWTKALKYMLTDLKWILTWCAKNP